MHQIREEILQITPLVFQIFEALGLMVNMEKSLLIPQQELEFLGFLVNSVSLYLAFPTKEDTTECPNPYASTAGVNKRHIARFVGRLQPQQELSGRLHSTTGPYNTWWTQWLHWTNPLQPGWPSSVSTWTSPREPRWTCPGGFPYYRDSMMVSPLVPLTPDITIESDASNTGWGACQRKPKQEGCDQSKSLWTTSTIWSC